MSLVPLQPFTESVPRVPILRPFQNVVAVPVRMVTERINLQFFSSGREVFPDFLLLVIGQDGTMMMDTLGSGEVTTLLSRSHETGLAVVDAMRMSLSLLLREAAHHYRTMVRAPVAWRDAVCHIV
jgi:hypothetical protein